MSLYTIPEVSIQSLPFRILPTPVSSRYRDRPGVGLSTTATFSSASNAVKLTSIRKVRAMSRRQEGFRKQHGNVIHSSRDLPGSDVPVANLQESRDSALVDALHMLYSDGTV